MKKATRPFNLFHSTYIFSCPVGSAAAQKVLKPGDEIVQANDRDFTSLSHYTAWNYLKSLPEGNINLVIHRKS